MPQPPQRKFRLAKALRKKMSPAEVRLWVRLRERDTVGCVVRRSYALGPYVLDFFCDEANLCIEVDGVQHTFDEAVVYDQRRDAYLKQQGIDTLRIPSIDIMQEPDGAATYVLDAIKRRLPLLRTR